ncbi:MAG: RNA polymerase sigma-70 factor [Mucilaginibacter sp.]|uniref:RNA polymerase sigma-70 factor n=1 Tax=Mucilaginibacter sp. TaxID=1882438 RepID=UPI0031A6E255
MDDISAFPDHALSKLLKTGSHEAYNEIYKRYFGLIFINACKRIANKEDAQDIVQEIFINLWNRREYIDPERSIGGYLYAATRNKVIDWFSQQALNSRYINSFQSFYETGNCVTDYTIREKQLASIIEREIDSLPPRMREIFILSRRANLSHKQIARQLDLSELTVKTQVKHALKILRTRLGLIMFIAMILGVK